MKEEKFQELLQKLNSQIHDDEVDSSVSPTLGSGCGNTQPVPLFITNDMSVEALSSDELILAHVLLHKFYGQKTHKDLSKTQIKELHEQVKVLLPNHQDFDRLDKSETN